MHDSEKLKKLTGLRSYNFGVYGRDSIFMPYCMLKHYLANASEKPKLIIASFVHSTFTLEEVYQEADELKMIIHNKSDFDFAEQQAAKVSDKCGLYLQPEWSKKEKMTPQIVDYVMKNPKWKISLQTHKYLNIP